MRLSEVLMKSARMSQLRLELVELVSKYFDGYASEEEKCSLELSIRSNLIGIKSEDNFDLDDLT